MARENRFVMGHFRRYNTYKKNLKAGNTEAEGRPTLLCSGSIKEARPEKNILKINIDFYVNYIADIPAISTSIRE